MNHHGQKDVVAEECALASVVAEREESSAHLMELGTRSKCSTRSCNKWTATLRRVSLLNTLLVLALSSTKLHAHASPSARVTSQSTREADVSKGAIDVGSNSDEERKPKGSLLRVVHDEDELVKETEEAVEPEEEEDASGDPPHSGRAETIIVTSVDGTMAAIEGSTGKLLWKKNGKGSKFQKQKNGDDHDLDGRFKIPRGQFSGSKLLHPLTATTTTTGSTSDSSVMAAIPSINGNVFLTTVENSNDPRTTPTIMTRTETASLKDLVGRSPYVDSSGRFFVGSRHATAAAIDSHTGEILYAASAQGSDEDRRMTSDPEWEGRSVCWIGRVDYSVSVYNAKSSSKEVRFSASEIMSVNDMLAEGGGPRRQHQGTTSLSGTSERSTNLMSPPVDELFKGSVFLDENKEQLFSALVATPSGNLAYRNQKSGRVDWVADETFETPIVYAIHSSSGHSLDVDIIPDVTMPSNSKEYLKREIERQIELTLGSGDDSPEDYLHSDCYSLEDREILHPSIVGTLLNGQLYAMPLGRRQQFAHPSHSTLPTAETQQHALDLAGVQRHHTAASTNSLGYFQGKKLVANGMPLPVGRLPQAQDGCQLSTNCACAPSSPFFPGCLVKAVSCKFSGSLKVVGLLKLRENPTGNANVVEGAPSINLAAVERFRNEQPEQEIPCFDTDDNNFNHHHQRQRNYRRVLKILGSWLPPTIALLFVVSFELGRRKRQKDSISFMKQVAGGNAVDANDLLHSVDQRSHAQGDRQMIQVTDEVLGFGGHGTIVYRGTLEGRKVAVKRLLKAYLASADREISLLIESDGHPNVVRYFLKEVKGDFVYLALELCDLSLHTLIGTLVAAHKDSGGEVSEFDTSERIPNATKTLLLQIANGVKHLHSLRIVHNDLKPANILLALRKEAKYAEKGMSIYNAFQKERYVAKISDMGLGKMLAGQSSFGASASNRGQSSTVNCNGNVGIGPGTVGWMAPEAMRMKSTLSIASADSSDAPHNDKTVSTSTRASRSVDVFSLGCIFHSTIVPGFHPFGEWYEREANIMHNRPCMEPLKTLAVEAYDLVSAMIQHNPRSRPTAKQICEHPFFWSLQSKLSFICDLSDRLETDLASPSDSSSIEASAFSAHPLAIERNAAGVVGLNWDKALYKGLTEQRYRTYDSSSVRDLLRLVRNKKNHFQDLQASVRLKIGSTDGLMKYFESRFPRLLMHCYRVCCEILPPNDPLVEKYLLSDANYPSSYITASTPSYRKVPSVLVEEPQFASQEELSQCQTGEPLEPARQLDKEVENCVDLFAADLAEATGAAGRISHDEHMLLACVPLQNAEQIDLCVTGDQKAERGTIAGVEEIVQDGVVLWEGSTAARTLNCRGWARSDEEWISRCAGIHKRNATLVRCAKDPKFRTRLCNHWDTSMGTFCPMRKKNKCVFAHGPVELRVKEGKKRRWGKLVDRSGNNSNPKHSGGEDTYGAARSIESARKEEGKWKTKKAPNAPKRQNSSKKKL